MRKPEVVSFKKGKIIWISRTPPPSAYKAAYSGFETQRRRHQNSKTGVSVAPQKGLMSPQKFLRKSFRMFQSSSSWQKIWCSEEHWFKQESENLAMLLERLLEPGSKEDAIISINTFTFILSRHTNICLPTKWSKNETINLYFAPFTADNKQNMKRTCPIHILCRT